MKSIRSRFTYANVMATVAVFFAIGGGVVVAASGIGSKELDKVTIRKDKSPGTGDINGNFGDGVVGLAKANAKCKKGEELLGGGAKVVSPDDDDPVALKSSGASGNGWKAEATVDFGASGQITVEAQAICLSK